MNLPKSPTEMISRLGQDRKPRPDIGRYSAPQGHIEEAVSEIWSEVLGIDNIGRDDNLFDLGGDSIHMMLISTRILRRFDIEIAIDEFFDDPTISRIAATIHGSSTIE